MKELIMIKYGELTTKKDNRKEFIKILMQNIERLIKDNYEIIKDNSRMYIKCDDAIKISEKLKKIFGIHGISIVYKVNNNYDEVLKKSLEIMDKSKKTFKVVTKRSDKTFDINSMEYSRHLGGLILKNSDYKVDVHNPDVTIYVEIRNHINIYSIFLI